MSTKISSGSNSTSKFKPDSRAINKGDLIASRDIGIQVSHGRSLQLGSGDFESCNSTIVKETRKTIDMIKNYIGSGSASLRYHQKSKSVKAKNMSIIKGQQNLDFLNGDLTTMSGGPNESTI